MGRLWCMIDPPVTVNGRRFNVDVYVAEDDRHRLSGPIKLLVTVPLEAEVEVGPIPPSPVAIRVAITHSPWKTPAVAVASALASTDDGEDVDVRLVVTDEYDVLVREVEGPSKEVIATFAVPARELVPA